MAKIKPENGVEAIKSIQDGTLSSLLSGDRLVRLLETSTQQKNNYSVDELISDVRLGIFSEIRSNTSIDIFRRNLQKLFVSKLIETMSTDKNNTTSFNGRRIVLVDTDIPSIARGQLNELKNQLKIAAVSAPDRLTKFHLNDLVARIENAMKPK